jgi:hypothetical protein
MNRGPTSTLKAGLVNEKVTVRRSPKELRGHILRLRCELGRQASHKDSLHASLSCLVRLQGLWRFPGWSCPRLSNRALPLRVPSTPRLTALWGPDRQVDFQSAKVTGYWIAKKETVDSDFPFVRMTNDKRLVSVTFDQPSANLV